MMMPRKTLGQKVGVVINAPRLFEVARDAAFVEQPSGPRQGLALGLTGVVFAAASLEALINEVTDLAEIELQEGGGDKLLQAFVDAISEAEESRVSVGLKFIISSIVLTGRSYPRGEQPYQDFSLLMNLRNAIMHLRPTTLVRVAEHEVGLDAKGILAQLQARGLITLPGINMVTDLLNEASDSNVARWAVNAAAGMAQSFLSMFPEPFRSGVLIDQSEVFRRVEVPPSPRLKRPN
ncbi:MAG TPA: hypothetical protein VHF01_10275 [Candidatus Acidoferrum sp.]|nr:hypothetical protein [Candidatus Acidoferrum sp.]